MNNKSITVTDIVNNSILSRFNQSERVGLEYTNVIVKIQTADTLTLPNFGHAVQQVPNDWIFFFIAFALIICTIATAWLFKRRK